MDLIIQYVILGIIFAALILFVIKRIAKRGKNGNPRCSSCGSQECCRKVKK